MEHNITNHRVENQDQDNHVYCCLKFNFKEQLFTYLPYNCLVNIAIIMNVVINEISTILVGDL